VYEQYSKLAKYYDQIYHFKDYRKEANKIEKLIDEYRQSNGNDLLDVGCGTGKHLRYLRNDFNCVGVDISEDMLRVAKKNVPGVRFIRANMSDFRIGKRFDAILCLFSSIGYLRTREEITKTVYNFSKHLKEGGVLIVEPWFRKSDWRKGSIHIRNYESRSLIIARVGYSQARRGFSVTDERYLIAEKNKGISYVEDHQTMRFFEPDSTFRIMRRAGLNPQFAKTSLMPGRTPIIATKRRHPTFSISSARPS
jgi:ubiquinone/menaquinone biosynthesis C-methylase UbiE